MLISKELKALIEQFKLEYSEYSTQAGALYQCCDASGEFLKFVHQTDMGLTQRLGLHMFEFETKPSIGLCPKIYKEGLNEGGKQRADWHCIVGAKHFLIDWTARQYVEIAPFPLIIAKRGLHIRRNGGDFYTAIRLSHPKVVGLREEVVLKRQQGYVWYEDIGWQPPPMASYAAVGHGG
jgi:hypothetical protein